jgi:AraC-like DNA-binding protein
MDLQNIIITKIIDITSVYQPQNKKIEIKDRSSYALSFSTGGEITYTHNGLNYFSNVNQVIFHPKHANYTLHCTKSGSFPLIEFELLNQNISSFTQFKTVDSKYFLQTFTEMKNNFIRNDKNAKNFSLLYDVLDMLSPISKNDCETILYPAINALNNDFSNPELSVSYLANLCHVSECYFRRIFYKYYSISPKKYITNKRIKYAMQLLKEGNLNITEIAETCGFNNVYHFSKTFKEHLNIPPSEYAVRNMKHIL